MTIFEKNVSKLTGSNLVSASSIISVLFAGSRDRGDGICC